MKPELEERTRRCNTRENVGFTVRSTNQTSETPTSISVSISLLLLAVLVLLAIGREALGLQELGSSSSLAEGALVLFQESLLFLQSCFLVSMEALQLLKATLKLKHAHQKGGVGGGG